MHYMRRQEQHCQSNTHSKGPFMQLTIINSTRHPHIIIYVSCILYSSCYWLFLIHHCIHVLISLVMAIPIATASPMASTIASASLSTSGNPADQTLSDHGPPNQLRQWWTTRDTPTIVSTSPLVTSIYSACSTSSVHNIIVLHIYINIRRTFTVYMYSVYDININVWYDYY